MGNTRVSSKVAWTHSKHPRTYGEYYPIGSRWKATILDAGGQYSELFQIQASVNNVTLYILLYHQEVNGRFSAQSIIFRTCLETSLILRGDCLIAFDNRRIVNRILNFLEESA